MKHTLPHTPPFFIFKDSNNSTFIKTLISSPVDRRVSAGGYPKLCYGRLPGRHPNIMFACRDMRGERSAVRLKEARS